MIQFTDLSRQWNDIREDALFGIDEILSTGKYLDHPIIGDFETELAKFIGVSYVVSLNSGTDALVLSLKALGVGSGDEVITVPNTYFATVAAIIEVGATPIFVDVGEDHLMDTSQVEEKISKKTKAVIAVHLEGKVCDMNTLSKVCLNYGIFLIEDAAQSIGSTFEGRSSGSFGDLSCFSLHPLKNLNVCGDGGFIATDKEDYARVIIALRNQGQLKRNEHHLIGGVSRLDSIQAAIGLRRLKNLDQVIKARQINASLYDEILYGTEAKLPVVDSRVGHTYHLYVLESDFRNEIIRRLSNEVELKVHYPKLVTEQVAYKNLFPGYIQETPNALTQSRRILSLPVHQHLKADDIFRVGTLIKEIICG